MSGMRDEALVKSVFKSLTWRIAAFSELLHEKLTQGLSVRHEKVIIIMYSRGKMEGIFAYVLVLLVK